MKITAKKFFDAAGIDSTSGKAKTLVELESNGIPNPPLNHIQKQAYIVSQLQKLGLQKIDYQTLKTLSPLIDQYLQNEEMNNSSRNVKQREI